MNLYDHDDDDDADDDNNNDLLVGLYVLKQNHNIYVKIFKWRCWTGKHEHIRTLYAFDFVAFGPLHTNIVFSIMRPTAHAIYFGVNFVCKVFIAKHTFSF